MSITLAGICRAFLRSSAAIATKEREEHARREEKRRRVEDAQAAWGTEQSRRRIRAAVAARIEACRHRDEIVWSTEAERLAAAEIEATAAAKRDARHREREQQLEQVRLLVEQARPSWLDEG